MCNQLSCNCSKK